MPGAIVGAGTLITARRRARRRAAGARFGVSPGATDALLDAGEAEGLPLLPGAATASEAMRLMARGYDMLKFFPAEAAGGAAALKALGGPLPGLTFCPTGGITPANAADYLRLDNVACVGGSWLAPHGAVGRRPVRRGHGAGARRGRAGSGLADVCAPRGGRRRVRAAGAYTPR